ncbi:MAG: DUF1932 domain-containing protein [Hyphomicrobiaceae bacterium]
MAKPTVTVVAQGAMGSGVAKRLVENGVDVVTSLAGRSASSAERAKAVGMRAVDEAGLVAADIILSVLPPSDAKAFAERLAPLLKAAGKKPIFADLNAVSSATVEEIAEVIAPTGCPFVDGGIVGAPPREGYDGPMIYVSGPHSHSLGALAKAGLAIRPLDAPIGAASALKMSYAAITKGLTALASASILAADRYGAGEALHAELAYSQPGVLKVISRSVPEMFPKAYRFVGEMEEIADHSGRATTSDIYRGIAALYQELADDMERGGKGDIAALDRFFKTGG